MAIEIPVKDSWSPQELAAFIRDQIITANQDRHDQYAWMSSSFFTADTETVPAGVMRERAGEWCGTTACVAGWAAVIAAPDEAVIEFDSYYGLNVIVGEESMRIDDFARKALGLTGWQADYLFASYRETPDVIKALDAIAAAEAPPESYDD
jgi:hypothetical protein